MYHEIPYQIPQNSTTLQELKDFTYAMALDTNMGYNTIRLDPMTIKMYTIMFSWVKYSSLRLPLGFVGSADFVHTEIMELIKSLGYVQAYIDDLLVITRGCQTTKFSWCSRHYKSYGLLVMGLKFCQRLFCSDQVSWLLGSQVRIQLG
jgi:hypothetical protein